MSFRIEWFDLFAVQGILKSLLQHYNWKAPILYCSAFFMARLLYPYMTTGKTIALTIETCQQSNFSAFLIHCLGLSQLRTLLVAQVVKNLPAMQETQVQSLYWEDCPRKGNGNPIQYSCLENSMDRGALVDYSPWIEKSQTCNIKKKKKKSQTRLSD